MSMRTNLKTLSAAALLCAGAVTAQNARPIAFTNARIHTVSGDVVDNGTLVVRSGKIEAVGADAMEHEEHRSVDGAHRAALRRRRRPAGGKHDAVAGLELADRRHQVAREELVQRAVLVGEHR